MKPRSCCRKRSKLPVPMKKQRRKPSISSQRLRRTSSRSPKSKVCSKQRVLRAAWHFWKMGRQIFWWAATGSLPARRLPSRISSRIRPTFRLRIPLLWRSNSSPSVWAVPDKTAISQKSSDLLAKDRGFLLSAGGAVA